MLSRELLILMALLLCRVALTGRNRPGGNPRGVQVGLLYARDDVSGILKHSLEEHKFHWNYTFYVQKAYYEGETEGRCCDVLYPVCEFYNRGVKAMIVTSPARPKMFPYQQLLQLADTYHIPLFTYPWHESSKGEKPSQFIFTIKPSTVRASLVLMQYYGWKNVTFLKDQHREIEGAAFEKEMKSHLSPYSFNVLGSLVFHNRDDAVEEILSLQDGHAEDLNVILHSSPQLSKEIIIAYAEQGVKKRSHFLLPEPFIADDWTNSFRHKYIKVTRFGLVDPQSTMFQAFKNSSHASSEDALLVKEAGALLGVAFERLYRRDPSALADDNNPHLRQCNDLPAVPLVHGLLLSVDIKRNVVVDGFSGNLEFDHRGKRRNYLLHVMETTSEGDVEIGTWSDRNGLKMNLQLPFPAIPAAQYTEPTEERYIITSILEPPYLSKRGGRYVGFCKELINLLSSRLKFKYHLKLVDDGNYGSYNNRTGKWNGMIGEVIDGKADMALAPLIVTSRRSLAVDFTIPFQHQGITLLMKSFKKNTSSLCHLVFYPFAWQLWIFILIVYVAFGVFTILLYRYTSSPKYKNKDSTSPWYIRSWPLRVLCLVCLVFTIAIVSMYIASLGRILSHQQTTWSDAKRLEFKDVFRQSVLTGTPKILLLPAGSITAFFQRSRNPLYRSYWNKVSADSSHFVTSYGEGIRRVMESSGETAIFLRAGAGEYLSTENCDLQMTTGAVNVRGYAIALRLNHPLRQRLNEVLLSLREDGSLDYLRDKWWKSKCPHSHSIGNQESHSKPILLTEMDGLFYVLAVGFALIVLTTTVHLLYWRSRITSQSESHMILCQEHEQGEDLGDASSLLSCLKRINVGKS